ncbi:amidase [Sphingomonas profundi]|uniref:amidase n=1 Tax=Alterirhizorhabdus profundi TaxID=2681549 RepID=UPI0012E77EEB|nr:amidase [Sphingomonas profundi]
MRRPIASLLLAATACGAAAAPPVAERSIADLAAQMAAGTSSTAITRAYLSRIAAMDRRGPALHAVIAINPSALAEARASDARRRAGRPIGPLDGVPILVKDNIETADGTATTAGSLALAGNVPRRDAPVVARLRRAGAVILGKTNLSEWANIRSTASMSGWSAVGGLVRNPYVLDRTACGSSSGSGAAVAASFAAAALGTETDGSVICPASMNGLVGLKPTVGLVSRTGVVPISHSQDTPGPMARSVRDVAILFSAMIGSDPADPATAQAGAHARDHVAALRLDALRGRRIGVVRPKMPAELANRFEAALGVLRAQGATLVEVAPPARTGLGDAETLVLQTELKTDLAAYLATTPPAVTARTLEALIAFNVAEAAREMPYFGQDVFEEAARTKGTDDPAYRAARAASLRRAGAEGIDAMLRRAGATIIVQPSYGPAWPSDPVYGDQYDGPSASQLPAIAGYPHLTVPMGLVRGLPVGLSFIGPAYGEADLLAAGYAYEQASHARTPPHYLKTLTPD